MQRLLVIYNPNSSQFIHIKDEFLSKLPELKGVIIGKFAIKKAPFEENAANLKKVLKDGDLVIAAGGDATASVTVNAIIESKKDVTLAVLPYGNFNDLARTLGMMTSGELLGRVAENDLSRTVSLAERPRVCPKKMNRKLTPLRFPKVEIAKSEELLLRLATK